MQHMPRILFDWLDLHKNVKIKQIICIYEKIVHKKEARHGASLFRPHAPYHMIHNRLLTDVTPGCDNWAACAFASDCSKSVAA